MPRGRDAALPAIGDRFGRWTVTGTPFIEFYRKSGEKVYVATCRCTCGSIRLVQTRTLRDGSSTSCGCLRRENFGRRTHQMTHTPLYKVWAGMIQRCNAHPRYAERGILVCDEWRKPEPFMAWALSNGYRHGLTIDRKDNNGSYCPDNCHWVTRVENMGNREMTIWVTLDNERKRLADWVRDPRCEVTRTCIENRLRSGRSPSLSILRKRTHRG